MYPYLKFGNKKDNTKVELYHVVDEITIYYVNVKQRQKSY